MPAGNRASRIDIRYEHPHLKVRPPKGMAAIYALCCPDTEEPRYVGKAVDAIRRYRQHLVDPHNANRPNYHDNWIASVLDGGKRPILYILDNVDEPGWGAAERHYIALFKELGARLTNGNDGGGATASQSEERAKARLTDEQRAAIGRRLNAYKKSELYRIKKGLAQNYRCLRRLGADAARPVAARMRDLQERFPDLFPAKWASLGLELPA
jgi:hypothetical protein